uniref:Uncharacterized protein n=1 Tax=Oryza barthii TaxID=65489 RepID=A0A0D3G6F4_9ORYZ
MAVGEPMLSRKHPRPQQRGSRSSHTELRIPPRRHHSWHRHRLVAIHDSAFVPNPLPSTSASPNYLYPPPSACSCLPHPTATALVRRRQLSALLSCLCPYPPPPAAFAPNRLDVDALPSSSSSYLHHYPPLPAVSTPACYS